MKRNIYFRVSTNDQDFAQQQECVNGYFARIGIDPASIDKIVVEKVSGTINHRERKLAALIDSCESGDTIYISELSRLGRNMTDLYNIVNECCSKGKEEAEAEQKRTGNLPPFGITLVQCKDGTHIENNSIGGKALLFALSLAAEIEVANIRQRTCMGLDARKKQITENGYFISNAGNIIRKFGNPTGDVTAMIEGASRARTEARLKWFEDSTGFKFVREMLRRGKTRAEIIELFNIQHEINPNEYSTREGQPMSKGVLAKWIRMINQDLVIS